MSTFPQFDRSRLRIKPLDERSHDLSHTSLLALEDEPPPLCESAMRDLDTLGQRLVCARERVGGALSDGNTTHAHLTLRGNVIAGG